MAITSRDVYLLLLHIAKTAENIEDFSDWKITVQVLASVLHWFAVDKNKAVNRILAFCKGDFSPETIRTALATCIRESLILPLNSPDELKKFVAMESLAALSDKQLAGWNWAQLIYKDGDPEGNAIRYKKWYGFLGFRLNREMLLYAQRIYMAKRFGDYNPARKDLWKEHNRPWDYDHILPHKLFYNRKDDNKFMKVCQQWGDMIGNLRAWPFEDNRSDQMKLAINKLTDEQFLVDSFIKGRDECVAFSAGDDVRRSKEALLRFATASQNRLIRIYESWYFTLKIDKINVSDTP
jgi:hypothetical protein